MFRFPKFLSNDMELDESYTNYRRRASRQASGPESQARRVVCSLCKTPIRNASEAAFARHLRADHADVLAEKGVEKEDDARRDLIRTLWITARTDGEGSGSRTLGSEKHASGDLKVTAASIQPSDGNPGDPADNSTQLPGPAPPTQEAPTTAATSLKREGSRSQSPGNKEKVPPSPPETTDKFEPRPRLSGTLWTPAGDPARQARPDKRGVAAQQKSRVSSVPHTRPPPRPSQSSQGAAAQRPRSVPGEDQAIPALLKQPETRPISSEQLVAEVKGIYAGLVMVESKCIEVDNAQNAQNDSATKLNPEQWQALIALHRTLLHEHHDFFLASQHPSASPTLRRLASKYAMPARMWRHGIHSFLELLRHRLPDSLEHMLTFIYLAYSMMALLYETVPAFEDTWIEWLGDLSRYRMAIEDEDLHDRETWTLVSREWYSKASDKAPTTGRLYHHLAILARPNALQQLFYYVKSLCVAVPFESARESIMTLLDPVMALGPNQPSRLTPNELAFVCSHGIMFSKKFPERFNASAAKFISSLDNYIARKASMFIEQSYHMAITSCGSILGYGDSKNPIYTAIKDLPAEDPVDNSMAEPPAQMIDALGLANKTHDVILRRFGDPNILAYLHVFLAFFCEITPYPEAIRHVAPEFPWKLLSLMLNTLTLDYQTYHRVESERFPESDRPLPEDWAMRGLLWAERYLPSTLFTSKGADDSERYFENPSMIEQRKERVLYLGCRIAAHSTEFLLYDSASHRFSAAPQFDIEIPGITCEMEGEQEPGLDAAGDAQNANVTKDLEMPDLVQTDPRP